MFLFWERDHRLLCKVQKSNKSSSNNLHPSLRVFMFAFPGQTRQIIILLSFWAVWASPVWTWLTLTLKSRGKYELNNVKCCCDKKLEQLTPKTKGLNKSYICTCILYITHLLLTHSVLILSRSKLWWSAASGGSRRELNTMSSSTPDISHFTVAALLHLAAVTVLKLDFNACLNFLYWRLFFQPDFKLNFNLVAIDINE